MSDQEVSAGLFNNRGINYRKAALLLFIVFSALHLMIVVVNHYCFRTFAYDYSVYNFAFYDFAHFRVSPCTLYNSGPYPISFLQDHFSLALILLSPLYWLLAWLTGTYTLLVIQWAMILAGGWATYKLIVLKSDNDKLGLLSLIFYFALFGRYSAYSADCNLAIMGSAMVPVFFYFFEAKKLTATLFCFLFLALTREDYPIWLLFINLFFMIVHRRDAFKLRLASCFFIASLLFMALVFKVFIPALEDEHKKYTFFEFHALGQTPGEAIAFIFQHPLKALELLFVNHSGNPINDNIKLEFYTVYLLSGGLLLFLRPVYLIPFLPLLAKKMYTDEGFRWSISSYYSIEFVSLMPLMIFLVLMQLRQKKLAYWLGAISCALALIITLIKFYPDKNSPRLGGNDKYNFLSSAFYKTGYDHKEVEEAMNSIPKTAWVSASGRLSPHLALRDKIYYFPRVDDAEYIFLLKHDDCYYLTTADFNKWIYDLRLDADWKLVQEKTDFIIFYRPKKQG